MSKREFAQLGIKRLRNMGLAVTLLGAGLVFSAHAAPTVPDWVHAAASQNIPTYPADIKAVVLLDETTYTVGNDGRAVEHRREVIKVLRPQGRDYATPTVSFDKDSKILSMHAWSIDPAGHEYAMKDSDYVEISPPGEGGILYDDIKFRGAKPPGNDPGGVVAYEFERREQPYLAETTWDFQGDLPRLQERFTLVIPAGYAYTTSWAHHAKVDGADLENHTYRWEFQNVPAVDLNEVPLRPSEGSIAGRMAVHYSGPGMSVPQDGTWQDIGIWFQGLTHDRLNPTPEITAKATELTAGKTDFYDRIEAIGEFVQQKIRYFDIEMGIGGLQPHPAGDIFKEQYGDCKDKATLLTAMLASIGIHGALVMVDTSRGAVDPNAPSLYGNHMIAAIEIPSGYNSPKLRSVVTAKSGKRYLIFDPTWEKTPFGQLENNLQGSYGLLLEGDKSEILPLPVMDPKMNTIHRTAHFTLGTDGSIKGSVVDKRFGDEAERRRYVFEHGDAKQKQEFLDRAVAQDLADASLSDVKIENVNELNKDLTVSYGVTSDHFAKSTGPLLLVRPRVLGSYAEGVDHKERKVPIDLEATMQAVDEFDIDLPDGYTVDELPDPVNIDMGFASYTSASELRGHTLHYSRTYTVKQLTLPPEKYGEVQHFFALVGNDESSQAVLKRANKQ